MGLGDAGLMNSGVEGLGFYDGRSGIWDSSRDYCARGHTTSDLQSTGLGVYAIVEELAAFGATVHTCSRNQKELDERLLSHVLDFEANFGRDFDTICSKSQHYVHHILPTRRSFFRVEVHTSASHTASISRCTVEADEKSIELSFQLGSKLDTLLPGHPILVTRPPNVGHVFINEVRITEWDVYRDNRFIIHGVEDFFDPALQTVIKI
ncbi:hypothetical protein RJ639_011623 [Escallonia herrerae]|uniref:Uncharacterized protein n=1 Tax=Escallonia herrerae TaxID=1293975 RepID=A0AA88VQJ1_9ASTE|nr:hypothetical protein RJ639_011623 [Escallonia herrerae]